MGFLDTLPSLRGEAEAIQPAPSLRGEAEAIQVVGFTTIPGLLRLCLAMTNGGD